MNWKLSVSDLYELSELYLREKRYLFDQIAAVSKEDTNFSNTLGRYTSCCCCCCCCLHVSAGALERFDREWVCLVNTLTLYQHVSSSSELRQASSEADKRVSNFDIQMSMRVDVFQVVSRLVAQRVSLGHEEGRWLDRFLLKGRKNGLEMEEEQRNVIENIKQELSDLCIEFQQNLNEEKTKLIFNPDQLAG